MIDVTKGPTGHQRKSKAKKEAAPVLPKGRSNPWTTVFPVKKGGPVSLKTAKEVFFGLNDATQQAELSGKPVQMVVIIEPRSMNITIHIDKISPMKRDDLDTALARARIRGAERVADILGGDEMLSADDFAKEIRATRETVHRKRRLHEVLGLEGPKRGVRFPKWQLSGSGELLPNLPDLFRALGGHPWTVYRFLIQQHPELNGINALDALRRGRVKDVIAVAETIGTGSFT